MSRVGALALLIGTASGACTVPEPELATSAVDVAEEPDRLEQLFNGDLRVVDLTHPLSADMPYWPNPSGNPFEHDTMQAHYNGSPSMAAYRTPEHHGTHLDAPVHSQESQPSVDELALEDLFRPAVVIDVTEAAVSDPDLRLTLNRVQEWEEEHGPVPQGAIVLLKTGWGDRWDEPEAYASVDSAGVLHFPGYSVEAARFLVEERDISGIGIDALSVDPGVVDTFAVHDVVNGSGRYHLENVANLDQLPATGAYLIVAPIKIQGGSGGQVRIFAVVP